MSNTKKTVVVFFTVVFVLLLAGWFKAMQYTNILPLGGRSQGQEVDTVIQALVATSGDQVLFYTGSGVIRRLVVGETVGSNDVFLYEGATVPSSSELIRFTGEDLLGSWELGFPFSGGIIATVTSTLNSIIIITPK